MTGDISTHTVAVANGRIRYDARGAGPVLLLMPGGPVDRTAFARLAPPLAADYRVITFDPVGLSRSSLRDAPGELSVGAQAEDIRRLLTAVTEQPAHVFASCGGANIALALAAEFPELVRTMVVHEPPLLELLPDAAAHRAACAEMFAVFRSDGAGPAISRMVEYFGWDNDPRLSSVDDDGTALARTSEDHKLRNNELFFAHMFRAIVGYAPDLARLRALRPRLRVAGGITSAGQLAFRASTALAESLGTRLAHYPGGHGGFLHEPETFAKTLHEALANSG